MSDFQAARRPWHTPKLAEVDYAAAEELPVGTAAKRPWHAPKLEAVDYSAAEAGFYAADDGVAFALS